MDWKHRIYHKLPVPLQHAAVSAFGVGWRRRRLSPDWDREVKGFIRRERYTADQWRAHQTEQLRDLVRLAVTRVPYYREAWAGLGLTEERIARFTLDDVASLPILEKDATRGRPDAFLVDGNPADLTICPTSGSSGTPVRAYYSNDDFARSLALREARECRFAGVSFHMPRCTFSGRLVVPAEGGPPYHRYNLAERQVYFSAFHLGPSTVAHYRQALVDHRTTWGTGYAHAFELMAGLMLEQGLPPPPAMRAIITTSEKLTDRGRDLITRAFDCPVFEEYGQVEDAAFACEGSDGRLRVSPDAGLLELVDRQDRPIPVGQPGEGVVVATSFIRRSQLFIRYRLGDVAEWDDRPDALGYGMPILKQIHGRIEDVVVGLDGRRTVRFHGIFTEIPAVREAQVIQDERDHLTIKIVAADGYGDDTVREIQGRIWERLTRQMRVTVERVEAIPRTSSGKFQAVVSRVRFDGPGAGA